MGASPTCRAPLAVAASQPRTRASASLGGRIPGKTESSFKPCPTQACPSPIKKDPAVQKKQKSKAKRCTCHNPRNFLEPPNQIRRRPVKAPSADPHSQLRHDRSELLGSTLFNLGVGTHLCAVKLPLAEGVHGLLVVVIANLTETQ